MSVMQPENGKYRSMWKIYGAQMADKDMCKNYSDGYDEIKWGDVDRFEVEKQVLGGYKKIRYIG